jgi:hypothetical protein
MDEKPKNIWKKSLRGTRFFLIWLVLLVCIVLIFFIVGLAINNPPPLKNYADVLILLFFAGVGALVVLCLWAFIRWLFCWRNFKRFLFGCACLATLIALFYAEEDWRGKHDWEKFKHQWGAKGEKFDWQSIIPPPVQDDQNFAFSPVWIAEVKHDFLTEPQKAESWYGDRIYSEEVSNILSLLPIDEMRYNDWIDLPKGNWAKSTMTDLKPWQTYYRNPSKKYSANEFPIAPHPQSPAQDVLLALSKYNPVIDRLQQDSAFPYSRFPIKYDTDDPAAILLPHLAAIKRCAQVLQLRAIAELQNGQSEKALDDVKLMLRLTDSIRTESFLVSHLVRIAVLQIALQPVWEGLAEHQWSDEQLVVLDSELAKLDFLADYKLTMHGGMGFQLGIVLFLQKHPEQFPNLLSDVSSNDHKSKAESIVTAAMVFHLVPSGWFYQNQLHCVRAMEEFYLPIADVHQQTVTPALVRRADEAVEKERKNPSPFNILESLALPALGNAVKKFAYAQSSTDLARVAIALERYRLAHGEFPESLDALAPQFMEKIPHDIIGGQPLHYRRTDDGQFVLYSVGWNETDDGGVVVLSKGETPSVDRDEGDWVWRYPSK